MRIFPVGIEAAENGIADAFHAFDVATDHHKARAEALNLGSRFAEFGSILRKIVQSLERGDGRPKVSSTLPSATILNYRPETKTPAWIFLRTRSRDTGTRKQKKVKFRALTHRLASSFARPGARFDVTTRCREFRRARSCRNSNAR